MSPIRTRSFEMTPVEFGEICKLVGELSGIKLSTGKEELVRARLGRRLRCLGIGSCREYLDLLRRERGAEECGRLLDAISTHVTSFFRELDHFRYLRNTLLPRLAERVGPDRRRLRIWSAGCSSGEEPYSIAIQLCEGLRDLDRWDAKILATDLSSSVLESAKAGTFSSDRLEDVPARLRSRYFESATLGGSSRYQIGARTRGLVRFARLNLVGHWPKQGPFDAIFCRNVMMYFDRSTQSELVERYRQSLRSGGTLFIGHSESLGGDGHGFRQVQTTVYEKR